MKINLHTPIEEVQVQIIPLIDVIFCILTFFILASLQLTRQEAINIDLPKASSSSTSTLNSGQERQILPVTIDAVGQIYVEKQPVQRQQLGIILSRYLQANPRGLVVLYASRSATYNDVVELLDLLRQVGGNRVSLGIIPGSSGQSQNSLPSNPGVAPFAPNSLPTAPFDPQNSQDQGTFFPTPPAPAPTANQGTAFPQKKTPVGKTNPAAPR
jgi:biopolymer transport protein ExbD